MSKPIRSLAFLALVVPSLLLGGNLFLRLNALTTATDVLRLPLGGYDPVSVLHGHYISITFDRNAILAESSCKGPSCCLCFYENTAKEWKADTFACAGHSAKTCARKIEDNGLLSRPYRYYVDERKAARLDSLLNESRRNTWERRMREERHKKGKTAPGDEKPLPPAPQFSMDTVITDRGEVAFKMLLIDGKPFMDYLNEIDSANSR